MTKQFIEHRPAYFSGFENITHNVNNFDEVLKIPFVKNFSKQDDFYSYAVSIQIEPNYKLTLMALYNWTNEFNGCSLYFVVGYLPNFVLFDVELKEYTDLIARHKPNCWTRKYYANKDLLNYKRPKETIAKVLKELGWYKDDNCGISTYCDCGFNKLNNMENNNKIG